VGKVARRLIDSRTPIAVLPTGTANNIATALGIADKKLPDLIKGWTRARCVNFDAGLAKGPWGSEYFIEGFGIGVFAEAMSQLEESENADLPDSGESKQIINSALSLLKKRLQRHQAKNIAVRLDGKDLSGDYVVLEALNICSVGPNLKLAPKADFKDGFLDVVLVPKRQRTQLRKYVADNIKNKRARPDLPIRRGQHLQIEWESSPVHIDDTAWPDENEKVPVRMNAIHVDVHPAALVFLIPKIQRTR
jgi:diacylglycerol kinase family enzyme